MPGAYGTNHPESEAILAAEQGDADTLIRLITDMLPGERRELAAAATTLSSILWDAAGRPLDGWGPIGRHGKLRERVAELLADSDVIR
jgi:hypothetical protein